MIPCKLYFGQGAGMYLREAIETYLDRREREGAKTATVRGARTALFRLLAFVGNVHVGSLLPEDISAFFYGLPNKPGLCEPHQGRHGMVPGIKGQSFNKYLDHVSVFCRWLATRKMTQQDLMADMRRVNGQFARRPEEISDVLHLTAEQMYSMIESARYMNHRIFLALACQTGCRVSEVQRMNIGDLNVATGMLTVWRTKNRRSVAEPDQMTITPELWPELEMWLTEYAEKVSEYEGRPFSVEDLLQEKDWSLVPSAHTVPVGGKGNGSRFNRYRQTMRLTNPENIVRDALSRMGVNLPLGQGCHCLRRSVADVLYENYGIEVAQAQLGHQSSETTRKYLRRNRLRDARNEVLTKGFMPKPELAGIVSLDERRRASHG